MKTSYLIIFDRESDGRVIASVPGVTGCHAYGRSRREAVRRVTRALRFYLATS
jgi:predicted RNase H-like HicB family nuclease